jgi:hypothetical protein
MAEPSREGLACFATLRQIASEDLPRISMAEPYAADFAVNSI